MAALLGVATLLASPGFGKLVLCVGTDGHLEVELSVNGRCGTAGQSSPVSQAEMHGAEGDCCTACLDVSMAVASQDAVRASFRKTGTLVPEAASAFALLSFQPAPAPVGSFPLPPPWDSPHLTSLRTVRLLV